MFNPPVHSLPLRIFDVQNCVLNTTQVGAAIHTMLALRGCQFTARIAGDVSVKFEDSLLLEHNPSDPGVGHGQQHEQSNDGTSAKGKELNT